jgi:hypothetical protein
MEKFARLSSRDRSELVQAAADRKRIHPAMIEKDFWVCWTLRRIYGHGWLKDRLMFKGGTSLSKAHRILERMSEDIDLVLRLDLFTGEDQPLPASMVELARVLEKVKGQIPDVVSTNVLPRLKEALSDLCGLEEQHDSEGKPTGNIMVVYPSGFTADFLKKSILLEFGPRSAWEPHDQFEITPNVVEELASRYQFEQPTFYVTAIRAERTFWEKAAILHSVAVRPVEKPTHPGYSRHYYDVQRMFARADLMSQALADTTLLEDVVEYRRHVWPESWVDYSQLRRGSFKLVPQPVHAEQLAQDYTRFRDIIFGTRPEFGEILDSIAALERELNTADGGAPLAGTEAKQ